MEIKSEYEYSWVYIRQREQGAMGYIEGSGRNDPLEWDLKHADESPGTRDDNQPYRSCSHEDRERELVGDRSANGDIKKSSWGCLFLHKRKAYIAYH